MKGDMKTDMAEFIAVGINQLVALAESANFKKARWMHIREMRLGDFLIALAKGGVGIEDINAVRDGRELDDDDWGDEEDDSDDTDLRQWSDLELAYEADNKADRADECQKVLVSRANRCGLSMSDIESTATWADTVDMMRERTAEQIAMMMAASEQNDSGWNVMIKRKGRKPWYLVSGRGYKTTHGYVWSDCSKSRDKPAVFNTKKQAESALNDCDKHKFQSDAVIEKVGD